MKSRAEIIPVLNQESTKRTVHNPGEFKTINTRVAQRLKPKFSREIKLKDADLICLEGTWKNDCKCILTYQLIWCQNNGSVFA